MAEITKIEWCHHTFNPWRGCTKVSPGRANCYAEKQSRRNPAVLGVWGDGGTRVVAAESYWRLPVNWNAASAKAGERRRVFCASLADVFEDRPELVPWRVRLFHLISETPHLDWLLLTKRPENVLRFCGGDGVPPNVWLGTSVEDQQRADERIPHLLRTPAAVRFLSCEPLLGAVVLHKYFAECECGHGHGFTACPNTGGVSRGCHVVGCACPGLRPTLHWVIAGGESGPRARPCDVEWVRSLVAQCKAADVACFVKQLGANPVRQDGDDLRGLRSNIVGPGFINDPKGGNPAEWEADLRVREFPR